MIKTKPIDIAHVRYQHPDLDEAERFLTDFGFTIAEKTDKIIYFRGTGSASYIYVVEKGDQSRFIGLALQVKESNDLELITKIPEASDLNEIEAPGGGSCVTLTDPNNFRIDLVHGIKKVEELPLNQPLVLNNAQEKRRFGTVQRPPKQPAPILRLGHIALDVLDFKKSYQWYANVFGMIATDLIYYGHPSYPIAAFLRCDNGKEFVDHHTIALSQGPKARVHHVGCEVQDFDTVQIGHEWLQKLNYKHIWGVGRHLLGSQVFDYWQDPFGSFIEHFTDGDIFNNTTETVVSPGSLDMLYQWGGPTPQTFLD